MSEKERTPTHFEVCYRRLDGNAGWSPLTEYCNLDEPISEDDFRQKESELPAGHYRLFCVDQNNRRMSEVGPEWSLKIDRLDADVEPEELGVKNGERCYICKSAGPLHNHHVSYQPERTILLCATCHGKVHRKDGFHDHLKPLDEEGDPVNVSVPLNTKPGETARDALLRLFEESSEVEIQVCSDCHTVVHSFISISGDIYCLDCVDGD